MSSGYLFPDMADEPPRARHPKRDRRLDWVTWPKTLFSIECQLPACVVVQFPGLAAELRDAIRDAEGWLKFLDILYGDHDERPEAVRRDVLRAIAATGITVRPKALKEAPVEVL